MATPQARPEADQLPLKTPTIVINSELPVEDGPLDQPDQKPSGVPAPTTEDLATTVPFSKDTKSSADLQAASQNTVLQDKDEVPAEDGIDPSDPIWARAGGPPRFGIEKLTEEEAAVSLLDVQTALEGLLPDHLYGDWYHNTGIIVFACCISWLVGVIGGGMGWLMVVLAFCSTYYRTSIRRVRANYRDDVLRELSHTRLETETETIEWMNSFLVKFWPIYSPVVCATIINTVDQVLSSNKPPIIDTLTLKEFTLGTKPPRMEFVKTLPKAQDDVLIMDWKFSFTPNDTSDMTSRQLAVKTNPKVVLEARIGRKSLSKGFPVIVEDMSCTGFIRLKIKFQLAFPHIEKVEMCFLEPPEFGYVCKPIGGSMLNMDVNFIPGLTGFINQMIHGVLRPMMYAPKVFPIEVAKLLAGGQIDQAAGVLSVTLHRAQGLHSNAKFGGTMDPYAVISINSKEELARSKIIDDTANPSWNETFNILPKNLNDTLTITIFDRNEFRKDKEIGVASFPLERLDGENNSEKENLQVPIMDGGKSRGLLHFDLRFAPVLEETKLPDGKIQPPPEMNTGILRFTVEQAKELDSSKSLVGKLNPYALLYLNGRKIKESKKMRRTNQPVFPDAHIEILVTNRTSAKLGIKIKDDRDLATDPVVGSYDMKLDDMIESMTKGRDWFDLHGCATGKIKVRAVWRPVELKGAAAGAGGYVTPIGVMRFRIKHAVDVLNLERVGRSDPYVSLCLSGIQKARTVTFENHLDPVWNEVFYIPVHSTREVITLEVKDEEKVREDRRLGLTEVSVSNFAIRDENGEFIETAPQPQEKLLKLNPTDPGQGVLHFTAAFYPSIPVIEPEDEEEERPSTGATIPSSEAVSPTTKDTVKVSETEVPPSSTNSTGSEYEIVAREGESEVSPATPTSDSAKPVGLRLDKDNFANYESGLLVYRILDAHLPGQDCHVQMLNDDNIFPTYSSKKIKKRKHTINEFGDVMIRELEYSQITFRIVEDEDSKGEKEDHKLIAKTTRPTLSLLRDGLYNTIPVDLFDEDGRVAATLEVAFKYVPIKINLPPRDSYNNQGVLSVTMKSGRNLPSADRNGLSDPFCRVYLYDLKEPVHKTETQRKTLDPNWMEMFEVGIRSRYDDDLKVVVYDWDRGSSDDFLGFASIPLVDLEPMTALNLDVPLRPLPAELAKTFKENPKIGPDVPRGSIQVTLNFKPAFVKRSRLGTSTFQAGKVLSAPVFVGSHVISGVGKVGTGIGGIGKGLTNFVKTRGSTRNTEIQDIDEEPPQSAAASIRNGLSTPHHRQASLSSLPSTGTRSVEAGRLEVAVASVAGVPEGDQFEIELIATKTKKTILSFKTQADESGSYSSTKTHTEPNVPADTQLRLVVYRHRVFKKKVLGESLTTIPDQGSTGLNESVVKELDCGQGIKVTLHLRYSLDESSADSPQRRRRSIVRH